MIGKLTITVTKTADGRYQYMQIASPAAMPVNIVLIADDIVIEDRRVKRDPTPPASGKEGEGE